MLPWLRTEKNNPKQILAVYAIRYHESYLLQKLNQCYTKIRSKYVQKWTDTHIRRTVAHLEYPTLSAGNSGPPDTIYLYYSHVEGVSLKVSLLPA